MNQEGLVMTRLKELGSLETTCFEIQHGRGREFLQNLEEVFETILSQATHVWNYEMDIKRSSYRED